MEIDPEARMADAEECERYPVPRSAADDADLPAGADVYMYDPGEVAGLSQHPRMTQFLWQDGGSTKRSPMSG
jgi:hypothetical protein